MLTIANLNGLTIPAGSRMLRRVALALSVAVLLGLSAACGGGGDAPKLSQPDAVGLEVATEYVTLLQENDLPGLQAFISDAFIIQRADGSTATKSDYLTKLPQIGPFEIGDVTARQAGSTLVVRWTITVQEVINGSTYNTAPAPRLSTFAWNDGRWQLTSHANFNAPASDSQGASSGR
jgi:hypothetical protein